MSRLLVMPVLFMAVYAVGLLAQIEGLAAELGVETPFAQYEHTRFGGEQ